MQGHEKTSYKELSGVNISLGHEEDEAYDDDDGGGDDDDDDGDYGDDD